MADRQQPAAHRVAAEKHGRRAEALAALYLRLKGYRILARRYRTPVGEIDLIARRGRTIAFVEVKARASRDAGAEAVTPFARQRISRAADAWLARNPAATGFTIRIDILVMVPRRWPYHLQNAFGQGGRV